MEDSTPGARNEMIKAAFQLGLCIAAVLAVGLVTGVAVAKEFRITPSTDVEHLAKQVQAGDSLVLANGLWKDADLKFEQLPGTADAPVRIRAETAGQVVFTGATEFRFSGQYVIVSGLVFRDTDGASDVVQLRTHSQRHAHHCRMTDCVFEQSPESKTGMESRWLSVYGTENRIDHCYFGGKRSRGPTLVVWVGEAAGKHRIDHNHFGSRPPLGRNGGETIRIGTSDVSERNCQTIVEDNYFHACDGESEIISNKSCENIYRRNVFDACSGALTLRHGHRCLVDSNVFLGRTKRGTGGVRIIGRDHVVTNNYFEGLRGDSERAAICLMNGIPNGPLNGYAPVVNALVAHNTFIDCKVTLEIGYGAGSKQSAAPAACRITHNLFCPGKWPLMRRHAELVDSVWRGNKQQRPVRRDQPVSFELVDVPFERAVDGLLRPTSDQPLRTDIPSPVARDLDGHPRRPRALAGCDDPRTPHRCWPSPANTGPTWKAPPHADMNHAATFRQSANAFRTSAAGLLLFSPYPQTEERQATGLFRTTCSCEPPAAATNGRPTAARPVPAVW